MSFITERVLFRREKREKSDLLGFWKCLRSSPSPRYFSPFRREELKIDVELGKSSQAEEHWGRGEPPKHVA